MPRRVRGGIEVGRPEHRVPDGTGIEAERHRRDRPRRLRLRVALSGDGSTAIVGAPQDKHGAGAAWVFVRSGETWAPQGGKITASGEVGHGYFGISVALSGDGNTALIGSPKDGKGEGATYVFTRSGETWTQRARFTGGEEIGHANSGRRVAISSDGQTALVGGFADNADAGAAWVFVRSGESWTQQGAKLTGPSEAGAGQFGGDVALSGEGNSALIGGPADNGPLAPSGSLQDRKAHGRHRARR